MDQHLVQQIAHAQRLARRMAVGRAGTVDIVAGKQGHRAVQRQIVLLDTAHHRDGNRHLDRRGQVPGVFAVVGDRDAGLHVLDVDAQLPRCLPVHLRQARQERAAPFDAVLRHGALGERQRDQQQTQSGER